MGSSPALADMHKFVYTKINRPRKYQIFDFLTAFFQSFAMFSKTTLPCLRFWVNFLVRQTSCEMLINLCDCAHFLTPKAKALGKINLLIC